MIWIPNDPRRFRFRRRFWQSRGQPPPAPRAATTMRTKMWLFSPSLRPAGDARLEGRSDGQCRQAPPSPPTTTTPWQKTRGHTPRSTSTSWRTRPSSSSPPLGEEEAGIPPAASLAFSAKKTKEVDDKEDGVVSDEGKKKKKREEKKRKETRGRRACSSRGATHARSHRLGYGSSPPRTCGVRRVTRSCVALVWMLHDYSYFVYLFQKGVTQKSKKKGTSNNPASHRM